MLVFCVKTKIIFIKPILMGSGYIVTLVWFPVDNSSCSCSISHELSVMGYIIVIISCNYPIDNVGSNTPRFLCVFNLVLTHDIGNMEHHHATYSRFGVKSRWHTDRLSTKVSFFWLEFRRRSFVILSSVLFGISISQFREDAYPPCNAPIDNVGSNTPDFYVFLIWYWPMT